MKAIRICMFFALFYLIGCTSISKEDDLELNTIPFTDEKIEESVNQAIDIFRHLYLPTEMVKLFEDLDIQYNNTLTNPVDNIDKYVIRDEMALNMGIYGVDMGYAYLFNQNNQIENYILNIKHLAQKLGIPENFIDETRNHYGGFQWSKDSLVNAANDIYIATDQYLRKNNQEEASALIIMGGWIEALHIALSIAEDQPMNMEILARIAAQENSLLSLINLMKVYRDKQNIASYLMQLELLKEAYGKLDIRFQKDYSNLDSINHQIALKNYQADISTEHIVIVREIIDDLRWSVLQ